MSSSWFTVTRPERSVPATTSPTPATLKNWSMRNSVGSSSCGVPNSMRQLSKGRKRVTFVDSRACDAHERRDGIRLKNWRSSGTLVPSTDEMLNTGVIADLPNPRTASMRSSVVRTASATTDYTIAPIIAVQSRQRSTLAWS